MGALRTTNGACVAHTKEAPRQVEAWARGTPKWTILYRKRHDLPFPAERDPKDDASVQKRRLLMPNSSLLRQGRREVGDDSVHSRSEVDHLVGLGFIRFDRGVDFAY